MTARARLPASALITVILSVSLIPYTSDAAGRGGSALASGHGQVGGIADTAVSPATYSRPEQKGGMFGKDHPFALSDLPPGRTREKLESLPAATRNRALEWMHRFDFPEKDLEAMVVESDGSVLYVDPAPIPCVDLPCEDPADPAAEQADGMLLAAVAAVDDAFALHSRPGAPNVVYLDFDGHTITGTAWNSSVATLYAKAFDLDGKTATFSDAERAAIAEIWHRVAEDFAPFDIDVTTEAPSRFNSETGRVLITSKNDQNGRAMPYNTAGGVAYVGVWGSSSYGAYSPALIYYDNLAKATTYVAEACAHEFGHNLGLSHDGTSTVAYYAGHGSGSTSWAPIMGNSYYNNVTQWSKGEYAGANNTQDDISVIAKALGLAGDDHGDTLATATPLVIQASGEIFVSNPETDPFNLYPENKGVIDTEGDWDYFSFAAETGPVDITVDPAWDAFYRTSKRGSNLDVRALLLDADGNTLAASDPTTDTYANITISVSAGTYYLAVTGTGNGNYSGYASEGEYFISGAVSTMVAPNVPPTAGFGFGCNGLDCSFTDASNDDDGSIVSQTWNFGDGSTANTPNPSRAYASAGTYSVTLTVKDDDGATDTMTKPVEVVAPNVAPTADFTFTCTGLSCNFTDASSDPDGSVAAWAWDFGDGVTAVIASPSHTYAGDGAFTVTSTVTDDEGANTTTSRMVTVNDSGGNELNLYSDDFNDGSMTRWTVVNDGTVDAPSSWSASSGQLVQGTNIYDGTSADPADLPKRGSYAAYAGGYGWTDYRLSLALGSDDDDAIGVMFRLQDNANYYRFSWDKQRNYRRLVKNVGGTFTLLAQDAVPYVQGQTYQLEIVAQGDLIEVWIDGALIFSVTDASLAQGTIAPYSWGNVGARFAAVRVSQ